jgi:ligand-binding sensor domain-containing protein/DNA-binding CsgD family transcriptional regulator
MAIYGWEPENRALTSGTDSPGKFVNLQADSAFAGFRGQEITSFFEDRDGMIWITSIEGGVMAYDPASGKSRAYTEANSGLSSNVAFAVVEDEQGTIWVATAGVGINYLPKGAERFAQSYVNLPGKPNLEGYRKTLLLDGPHLWIGTEGTGLYRLHTPTRTFEHFAYANRPNFNVVRDVHKAADGKVWVASDGGGLYILDPATARLERYFSQSGDPFSLNSNALLCLEEDQTGNIWLGTYNGGINIWKVNKTWFERLHPQAADDHEPDQRSVLSVYQSKNGQIWLGTDGGGLIRYEMQDGSRNSKTFQHQPADPNSLGGNVVKTIFEDRQGQMWIGMFGTGLNIFDPERQSFQPFPFIGNHIWSIVERKNADIWIGTLGSGIRVYDPENQEITYPVFNHPDSNRLVDDHIMVLETDRHDQVWIGTGDHGLYVWQETTKQLSHYRHDPVDSLSLSNDEIRSVYEDSQGRIWVGTEGGGLNLWLGANQFERIGKAQGLVANSVMGIVEDAQGMIWISTFEGLSRLDPESREIRNFDFHSGQNTNQFNQEAILRAQDGKLYFGGINGVNMIQPEGVKAAGFSPRIIFTDFKLFNQSIAPGPRPDGRTILELPIEEAEAVKLSYQDNSFSLSFAGIDYTSPLESVFAYRMEGFDERWQYTVPGQYQVNYTNLDPGQYVFKIKNQDQEGRLAIAISPPFWQTNAFRVLVFLLVIGAIATGVRIVIKRQEAAHKRQLLESEREILALKNEKLEAEVEAVNSKLMYSAVQMAHKNEVIGDIKKEVLEVQKGEAESKQELRQLLRRLDRELKNEDYWQEFNLYFNQVDSEFIQALIAKHPKLTQNDLRICALLRLNLTTKEIASLLNITVRGVQQSRYRLKKRLGLTGDDNLGTYIAGFSQKTEL